MPKSKPAARTDNSSVNSLKILHLKILHKSAIYYKFNGNFGFDLNPKNLYYSHSLVIYTTCTINSAIKKQQNNSKITLTIQSIGNLQSGR
ncbi:MAG: hypothetical protein LBB88_03910 [Planctomycetaceae bacterium]|nr:hypothetical protein [Planctomycetaceae bacterium]